MFILGKILGHAVAPIRSLISLFGRIVPPLKKLGHLSVPARFALLMFMFLLITAIAFYVKKRFFSDNYFLGDNLSKPLVIAVIIILMIVIPILVYFLVRKLLEGNISRFPDIDSAWKAGVNALKEQGINIANTPLFLVLGSPDSNFSSNLIRTAQIDLNVNEVPSGPAALHWYANQDAIYLFCTQTCCLSKLSTMSGMIESGMAAAPPPPGGGGGAGAFNPGGTIMADGGGMAGGAPPAPPAGGGQPPGGQTIVGGPALGGTQIAPGAPAVGGGPSETLVGGPAAPAPPMPASGGPPAPPPGGAGMATLQIDRNADLNEFAQSIDQAVAGAKPALSAKEVNLFNARLEHVCRLLRKARQPVCPMNGILTLIPFGMIDCVADQVQTAAQRDLAILRSQLKLRCPLTVLVTEMEREAGFRELVRRVGPERAKNNRFGKSFNVWNAPTDEQLEAVGRHSCIAFEDWIYMLYKEREALRKPGNKKLFGLLCKIRGTFTQSLANVLADGFGYKPDRDPELNNRQFMFSGCYFAATGVTEDLQAFVRSVVHNKMSESEGELSWMEDAMVEEERYQLAANLFTLVGLLSMLTFAGLIAIEFDFVKEKLPFVKRLTD